VTLALCPACGTEDSAMPGGSGGPVPQALPVQSKGCHPVRRLAVAARRAAAALAALLGCGASFLARCTRCCLPAGAVCSP
jgi:hypothetical protein